VSGPTKKYFKVDNWFAWMIEAHHEGYSDADIRWLLKTVGVWDRLVEIVKAQNREEDAGA
jgi:hypothetical protein